MPKNIRQKENLLKVIHYRLKNKFIAFSEEDIIKFIKVSN